MRIASVLAAAAALCGHAHAGLIGDSVTFNGVTALITGHGQDISTTVVNVPTEFSFTDDTLTLTYPGLSATSDYLYNGGSYSLSFAASNPVSISYVSGPFAPLAPVGFPSPPDGICSCTATIPFFYVSDLSVADHAVSFSINAFAGTPFSETFAITTVREAPSAWLALTGLVAVLALRRRTRVG